ncbi:MAG: hypothetical protein SVC26_02505 [Pseudomonadota bacterium]|nr:hypothetical protein [Pseudomonadota bacterium]
MKIKVLWGWSGQEGLTRKGQELDVAEARGKLLIAKGLAEEVVAKKPARTKKAEPQENK